MMALPFRISFNAQEEQAFPGDTYLADMKKAAYSGKPWAKTIFIGVILGFFADLYFLSDVASYAIGKSNNFLIWIVAGALVALYLFVGHVFGKKLQDYIVFRDKLSLASAIIALLVLVLALFALAIFRLAAETDKSILGVLRSLFAILASSDEGIRTAVSSVFVMTLIMFLSAYMSALHAYYSGDAVSEAVYRKSVAALPADRALYNNVFFERSNNVDREREYEERERELDKRAVDSAFRLGSLASQLNGMVDPADAHEFMQAQQAISADYFSEGRR